MEKKTLAILNTRLLCEQILYFSDYLDREAEALWPVVMSHDYVRDATKNVLNKFSLNKAVQIHLKIYDELLSNDL